MKPTLILFAALFAAGAASGLGHGSAYPDPARFADAIAAFEHQDSLNPPRPGGIVAIGSSSMRMWHDRIAQDLAPLSIIPRGFGGSTMWDALVYAPAIITPYHPRAILLYEGDNDVDFGVPAEQVAATFDALMDTLRAKQPSLRVYLLSIKPSPARRRHWPEMRRANVLLADICADDSLLTYVDVATPMLDSHGGMRPEIYLPDSLHLNAMGYDLWTEAVRPVLIAAEAGREGD